MNHKHFEEDPLTKKERREERKIARRRDRSKYKKTDKEKRERHARIESEKKLAKQEGLLRGRVLAIRPEQITVESEENKIYLCSLRGTLKKEITHAKNLITVGDFVHFDPSDLSIIHVEERRSVLSRQEHLRRRQKQLIAANIDQVLITVSVCDPTLKPHLVDRYIIATYKGGMEPVIVINKIDLLDEERELFDLFIATYSELGLPVIALSATTGEGIDRLKEQMRGKASVFSGQSGVGKSSLINAMTNLDLAVGEVTQKTRTGSHTTSEAQLIPLEFGGWCIDTPGIRSFGVWDLKKEDLEAYFPEIADKAYGCKFPNCSHSHEPDCAVKEAVEKGELSPLRFLSYLKLLEEISS